MEKDNDKKKFITDKEIIATACGYLTEAQINAQEWQDRASETWDVIHGRIDWGHKKDTQSKIHLNRVGLAQEQIKATITQGLMNFEDWIEVEPTVELPDNLITPGVAKRIVLRAIGSCDIKSLIADNIGIAAVENILATKLQPYVKEYKGPGGAVRKEFKIKHIPLSIRNYYPDITGSGLYEIHEAYVEKHKLLKMCSDKPNAVKPYDREAVKTLHAHHGETDDSQQKQFDEGQETLHNRVDKRQRVLVHELWCTILDENGEIAVYETKDGKELPLENVIITLGNKEKLLHEPKANPNWSGDSNFVSMSILAQHTNVYGRGMLEYGAAMNKVENELLNVAVDAALKEGHNVNVVKMHGLADPDQVSGGIEPNSTLLQNSSLAPGEKLIETQPLGRIPQAILPLMQIVKGAGAENMQLNDRALTGGLPTKQVRATEIAQADRAVQALFEAMIARIEDIYIEKYAKTVFNMVLQNKKHLNDADLNYIFYGDKERIEDFKEMTATECYKDYAHSFSFRGKGIRSIAASVREGQAMLQMMNMAASNPLISEQLERSGIAMPAMFKHVLRTQGIDIEKLKDPTTADFAKQRDLIREQALAQQEAMGNQTAQAPGAQQTAQAPMAEGEVMDGGDA